MTVFARSVLLLGLCIALTAPVHAGLLGHWAFDNNYTQSGDSLSGEVGLAPDAAAGAGGQAPTFSSDAKFGGQSMYLDGQSFQYASVADDGWDDNMTNMTIAVWIKRTYESGTGVSYPYCKNRYFHSLKADESADVLSTEQDWDYTTSTSLDAALPLNQWAHVATVIDTTQHLAMLYIDGDLVDSVPTTRDYVRGSSDPLLFGTYDTSLTNGRWYFDGLFDECWIYDAALSEGEIENLMAYNNIVPEPALLTMLLIGAVGVVARRRRG